MSYGVPATTKTSNLIEVDNYITLLYGMALGASFIGCDALYSKKLYYILHYTILYEISEDSHSGGK